MRLFRKPKRKMNPRLFIICESKEDVENLWYWCYEHNFVDDINLRNFLDLYDKYVELNSQNVDGVYEPPMFVIDPKYDNKLAFYGFEPSDKTKNEYRAYKTYREHAIHAKDIDFDFLRADMR